MRKAKITEQQRQLAVPTDPRNYIDVIADGELRAKFHGHAHVVARAEAQKLMRARGHAKLREIKLVHCFAVDANPPHCKVIAWFKNEMDAQGKRRWRNAMLDDYPGIR